MASTPPDNTITVFIDSTVLMTASISSMRAGRDIIEHALAGKLDAYISDDVLEETERNISLKAPMALATFYTYRDLLSSKVVDPFQATVEEVAKLVESKDAPIVAGAIAAHALYLATYDQKHLLKQRSHIWESFGIMVLTPIEILYLLPPSSLEEEVR